MQFEVKGWSRRRWRLRGCTLRLRGGDGGWGCKLWLRGGG